MGSRLRGMMLALNPKTYERFVRPLLFALPPERAQAVAEFALKRPVIWRALSPAFQTRTCGPQVELAGLSLANPIGLAAGYDKNCELLPSLAALGFGYITAGTVTVLPQPGNPKPRVFRHPREESLVNALGFPSRGLEFVADRLDRGRASRGAVPLVVSVSGVSVDAIVRCHRRLEPLADAIEINISSPNTAGLRVFQESAALSELLQEVNRNRSKPLFVKLPPYAHEEAARDRAIGLARACVDNDAGALTIANTRPYRDPRLAVGSGGLSGRPLLEDTLRMVADIGAEFAGSMPINACGGISTGDDALRALDAGAATVQLLTGLIYRGPGVAKQINRELAALRQDGR